MEISFYPVTNTEEHLSAESGKTLLTYFGLFWTGSTLHSITPSYNT